MCGGRPVAMRGRNDGLGVRAGAVGRLSRLSARTNKRGAPIVESAARPDHSLAADGRSGDRSRAICAALDLGTNNCRLLIARPQGRGFRVVDAFSRIVRLGEGMVGTGRLSDAAMARTVAELAICAGKMQRRGVERSRIVAG